MPKITGLLLVPLLAACGGAAKGGTVDIKLDSYSITANPASLNAGDATFNVKNIATDGQVHEFEVKP